MLLHNRVILYNDRKKFLLFKYIKNYQEYKIIIANNNLLKANIFIKYKLQKHLITLKCYFIFFILYINIHKFLYIFNKKI